ncbi:MAG TPA: hypothetical protein ENK27_11945, partial [Desulfobulbus sp.]|nr:hypothetical protein [Desulfobulbus sp.]
MSKPYRLDLKKIERSLHKVQKEFERINSRLEVRRDPLEDVIIENMLLGYRYIDRLLQRRVTLLHRKSLHHILELNHIVLCGQDPCVRKEFDVHIAATTERFYSQEQCNIGHLARWYHAHRDKSAWKRAAGIYILHLSQPQLFFEGNHRTGALIMSHILASDGKPPFVLRVDNAEAYFNPSTVAKLTRKSVVTNLWKLPKI